jgi:peptidylprolyl isomerase
LFAPYTGFIDGFPAARDKSKGGKVWLTHCPGTVALARNNDPDSSGTDFYIVIGQSPRYLDRNLTVFGRVVWGMDVVQRIKRGPALKNGIIEEDLERSWIKRMRLASSLEEHKRLDIYIADTNSKGFKAMLKERRNRSQKFFHHKPPRVLDVCQVPVPARLEKTPVTRP